MTTAMFRAMNAMAARAQCLASQEGQAS